MADFMVTVALCSRMRCACGSRALSWGLTGLDDPKTPHPCCAGACIWKVVRQPLMDREDLSDSMLMLCRLVHLEGGRIPPRGLQ